MVALFETLAEVCDDNVQVVAVPLCKKSSCTSFASIDMLSQILQSIREMQNRGLGLQFFDLGKCFVMLWTQEFINVFYVSLCCELHVGAVIVAKLGMNFLVYFIMPSTDRIWFMFVGAGKSKISALIRSWPI